MPKKIIVDKRKIESILYNGKDLDEYLRRLRIGLPPKIVFIGSEDYMFTENELRAIKFIKENPDQTKEKVILYFKENDWG